MPKEHPMRKQQPGPPVRTSETKRNPSELSESDQVILESATGEAQPDHGPDYDPAMLVAEDKAYGDVAPLPVQQTGVNQNNSGYDETADGLNDIEETTREQAENRALGDHKGYRP